MLTLHHLGKSQSERIVWLCEELAIPYELKRYEREPATMLAPPEYKALHPIGAAPVITDGDLVLAESSAIIEYIIAKYGNGGLAVDASELTFADYLYWLHFTNGTLQPSLGRVFMLVRSGVSEDNPIMGVMRKRIERALRMVEARLIQKTHLAGSEFTAADIMIVFTLTTMRHFSPFSLAPYPGISAYLQRIAERPAYQAAMRKGDPEMPLLLT